MKKTKLFAASCGVGLVLASVFLIAADHVDAPAVAGTTADIADLYAFQGDNPNSTVLVATVQGALAPGAQTANAQFEEDVLIEFKINNTGIDSEGNLVEDLVIQAVKRGDSMYFFGPAVPALTGLESSIATTATKTAVKISTQDEVHTAVSADGMSVFAGPRRDAFYFDFNRYNLVVSGAVAPDGFLPATESTDFFENLNVLAITVEVPNSLLGTAPAHIAETSGIDGTLPASYNVWATASRKQ